MNSNAVGKPESIRCSARLCVVDYAFLNFYFFFFKKKEKEKIKRAIIIDNCDIAHDPNYSRLFNRGNCNDYRYFAKLSMTKNKTSLLLQ